MDIREWGSPFANGVPIREWDFEGFTIRDKKNFTNGTLHHS